MANNNKKLAKNSLVYAIFTLLQRGFAFFLIPLYTTQLSTEEYGILGLVMAIIPFFVLIAGFSLRGSTAYFYYEYRDDREYIRNLWGTNFTFVLITSLAFAMLLWATKSFFLERFLENIAFYPYLFLALISISTQPIYFLFQSMLKAKQLAKKASLLDFSYFLTLIGLTLIMILVFNFKADGALLALAISNFIFFIVSIVGASFNINFCLDIQLLKKTLKYSLPVLPHNLSAWAMNLVDRVILNNLTSLGLVGLFDIGSQIGKLINVITLGVNSAYSPWFFEHLKSDGNSKKVIANVTNKIMLIYTFIAISVSWLAPELLKIISNIEYYSAWKVVPFIAFAFAVNGFYYSFSNVFFLEKTKYLPFITITGALINIALNFSLIPIYGIQGAAIASLLSKVLFAIIAFVISQRLYFIPYKTVKIILFLLIGFLIACVPYLLQNYFDKINLWLSILLKISCLLLLALPVALYNKEAIRSYLSEKNYLNK